MKLKLPVRDPASSSPSPPSSPTPISRPGGPELVTVKRSVWDGFCGSPPGPALVQLGRSAGSDRKLGVGEASDDVHHLLRLNAAGLAEKNWRSMGARSPWHRQRRSPRVLDCTFAVQVVGVSRLRRCASSLVLYLLGSALPGFRCVSCDASRRVVGVCVCVRLPACAAACGGPARHWHWHGAGLSGAAGRVERVTQARRPVLSAGC